jgi:hypothetical protein
MLQTNKNNWSYTKYRLCSVSSAYLKFPVSGAINITATCINHIKFYGMS